MCLVYLKVYEQTVAIKERFYLASFIQLETQADNIGVRSGVRPQLHRPRRRVRMSVVSAPNALLARRTAAPRAGVRAARSTSVVRCDASKGAESNNPRASLGRRDVFGAVAAGVALLSSSQPASALQPGDIGYLKAQREAAANAPPAPEPEPEPAAAPAPAKKTAKAKPAPKPKAPPKPKPDAQGQGCARAKGRAHAASPRAAARAHPATRHPRPRHHPRTKEGTKSSKQLTGVGFDVVAGVIATTLLLSTTSNKEYSADVSTKKAPTKPTGSGASDAKANAASAQRWIDEWNASGGDMSEDKAKEAQEWIDAWKAGYVDTPNGRAAEAQAWIEAWKK